MNHKFFLTQMQRLITRFGQKSFDQEFCKLIWHEVSDMSESGFQRFVDVMIGNRPAHKPPLVVEFREARIAERKTKFQNEVSAAAQALRKSPEEMRKHVNTILSKDFGKVSNAVEAFEVARIRLLTEGKQK